LYCVIISLFISYISRQNIERLVERDREREREREKKKKKKKKRKGE
jgi:hypothetical protein